MSDPLDSVLSTEAVPDSRKTQPRAAEEDFTGRDRMARNVLASWGSYLVIAATGLVLPRMMDRHLGQTALGVWDFGWLLGGGGLRGLALANLCGQIGADLTRMIVAYRICPELRIRFANATTAQARKILAFGAKTAVGGLSFLLLFQGDSLIVASHLGLPMLALFARPLALLKVAQTFADKFALVLTPIASSLQGAGRHAEVRQLVIKSTRFGAALAAPMTLGLAILGDPLLRLWMGPRYEQGLALAILGIGSFLPLTQVPVASILTGLNLHGPVSVARLAAAVLGVALGLINVWLLGWGLVGAAVAVALPFMIGSGIFIALYACRRLDISLGEYLRQGLLVPTACALPFALVLAGSRILLAGRPLLSVLCGSAAGVLVLGPLYWRHVLPGGVRESVSAGWARVLGRLDSRPT